MEVKVEAKSEERKREGALQHMSTAVAETYAIGISLLMYHLGNSALISDVLQLVQS